MGTKIKKIIFSLALSSCIPLTTTAITSTNHLTSNNLNNQSIAKETRSPSIPLQSVKLSGIKWKYKVGESLLAVAVPTPADATNVSYDWFVGNALYDQTHKATLSFNITEENRNQSIYVIARQKNGSSYKSQEFLIVVENSDGTVTIPPFGPRPPVNPYPPAPPPPPPPSKTLIDKVNEQKYNIYPSSSSVSETEFNSINSSNLLNNIVIPHITYSEKNQLHVVSSSFRPNKPYISFQLTDNRQISDTISVRWNIYTPPSPSPTPPTPTPPTKSLIDKVNEQKYNIHPASPSVNEAEFNSINSTNLLSNIVIPNITYSEKNQLKVVNGSFNSNKPYITFQLTDNWQVSDTISVKWNIYTSTPSPSPILNNVTIMNILPNYQEGQQINVYAKVDGVDTSLVSFDWKIEGKGTLSNRSSFSFEALKEYDGKNIELVAYYNGVTRRTQKQLHIKSNVIESTNTPFYKDPLFFKILCIAVAVIIVLILLGFLIKIIRDRRY